MLTIRNVSSLPLRNYFGNKWRGKTHAWVFRCLSPGFPLSHMCTQETQRVPAQRETGALFALYTMNSI